MNRRQRRIQFVIDSDIAAAAAMAWHWHHVDLAEDDRADSIIHGQAQPSPFLPPTLLFPALARSSHVHIGYCIHTQRGGHTPTKGANGKTKREEGNRRQTVEESANFSRETAGP